MSEPVIVGAKHYFRSPETLGRGFDREVSEAINDLAKRVSQVESHVRRLSIIVCKEKRAQDEEEAKEEDATDLHLGVTPAAVRTAITDSLWFVSAARDRAVASGASEAVVNWLQECTDNFVKWQNLSGVDTE